MTQRGIDANLQKAWIAAIEKENALRLKWFRKNIQRLNDISNKEATRTVPGEIKEKFKQARIDNFQNVIKYPRIKTEDAPPREFRNVQGIMKPVDPAVTRLIYTGANKDGRVNYLHERIKTLPENRYYFPEVSSYEYGWKMWDCSKNMKKTGFGRQQVVKESFYRSKGVARDPEWYKEPAGYSVSVCTN